MNSSEFLSQFCDAVAILKVNSIFQNILSTQIDAGKRLKSSLLALLTCVLRESPENADLIETIVFDKECSLVELLKDSHDLCRYRAVVLLRLLGRYCCVALKKNWTLKVKGTLEDLANDLNQQVQNEAVSVLEEFKNIFFV